MAVEWVFNSDQRLPMTQLPSHLIDEILSRYPLPIADAVAALAATDNLHERRDRVVESFRTVIRLLAAAALAARIKVGAGPGGESAMLKSLMLTLRRQRLTDGQWVGLTRELLSPWSTQSAAHPIPELVHLFTEDKGWQRTLEGLFTMRRLETIAHGQTGETTELQSILEKRLPELAKLLEKTAPLWTRLTLLVPMDASQDDAQVAWLWMGDTPSRARWRRVPMPGLPPQVPGQPILVDLHRRSVLELDPVCKALKANPETPHELFMIDGSHRKAARYVAIPSLAEHRDPEGWKHLAPRLMDKNTDGEGESDLAWERPYRGLLNFEAEDAGLYFGREQLSEALANRIRQRSLVTLTGASGTGKSSLVRAGVLPQLTGFDALVIRPGSNPSARLAHKLHSYLGEGSPTPKQLQLQPEALTTTLSLRNQHAQRRLLLVIDQAEELFTLCQSPDDRMQFARMLAAIAPQASEPGRVLLIAREDFFSRFATLTPIKSRFTEAVTVLTVPSRDALLRTLILPLNRFDYAFEHSSLPETMVDAVAGEPSALPLLQFCADRLWEHRDRVGKQLTWQTYKAIGGVEGALAAHADQTVNELPPGHQTIARRLLLRLVTPQGTRAVVSREELLQSAGGDTHCEQVLEHFVAARLLTMHEGEHLPQQANVELTHEALLQNWERLKTWQRADLDGQRLLQEAAQAARSWSQRGQNDGLLWRGEALKEFEQWHRSSDAPLSEPQKLFLGASRRAVNVNLRLRRRVLMSVALLLVAASTVSLFLYLRAQQAEIKATKRVSQLLSSTSEREIREKNPAVGILLALEAMKVPNLKRGAMGHEAHGALWAASAMAHGFYLADDLGPIETLAFDATGQWLLAGKDSPQWAWRLDNPANQIPVNGSWSQPNIANVALPLLISQGEQVVDEALGLHIGSKSSGALELQFDRSKALFKAYPKRLSINARAVGSPISALALDGNGHWLASAWEDGNIWLWNLDSAQVDDSACALVSRNLTSTEWRQFFHEEPYSPTCSGELPSSGPLAQFYLHGVQDTAQLWVDGVKTTIPHGSAALALPGGSHQFSIQQPGCPLQHLQAWAWPGGLRQVEFSACASQDRLAPKWLPIPGGSITYPLREADPNKRVNLQLEGFDILRTPVTVEAYHQCLEQGSCSPLSTKITARNGCNIAFDNRQKHPMNCISWPQAQAYCHWAGGELPSDAQWEYVATGLGQNWPYPWGEEPASCGLAILSTEVESYGCGSQKSWRVCSKELGNSPEGVCDLVGNVFEWVGDCRRSPDGSFSQNPKDGSARSIQCMSDHRLLRGGAFDWHTSRANNKLNRMFLSQDGKGDFTGFRCVRSPTTDH